ncbi:Uma2 family endonuclease [Botrimarina sp.]|uniref:Uma2 family endonuclease n=1 Tax=Botrimarina sp. TaxID=2795802 RepID=UPI0032EB427E
MDWSEIVDNPYLRDLPFKIEQDRYGNIVMSPANYRHGYFQGQVSAGLVGLLPMGRVVVECSVQTTRGVKVPDVAWHSQGFYEKHGEQTPLPSAPEICVEVLSPSNSWLEMEEKQQLYFAAGAEEVWVCDKDGRMKFFSAQGQLERSAIAADFPSEIH